MFQTALGPEQITAIEREQFIRDRADRAISKLIAAIEDGRQGIFVFVDSFIEGAEISALLVEHFGPGTDGIADIADLLRGKRQPGPHSGPLLKTPLGKLYAPQVFNCMAIADRADVADCMRLSSVEGEVCPGGVVIAHRRHRDELLAAARRHPEPA